MSSTPEQCAAILDQGSLLILQGRPTEGTAALEQLLAAAPQHIIQAALGALVANTQGLAQMYAAGAVDQQREQLAQTVMFQAGRAVVATLLRDWHGVWGASADGRAAVGQLLSDFETQLFIGAPQVFGRPGCQGCLTQIADAWAIGRKMLLGTSCDATSAAAAAAQSGAFCNIDAGAQQQHMQDPQFAALADALVGLVSQARDPASPTSALAAVVARTVVLRTVEEFGLFHPRAQRRGLPLTAHEALRSAVGQAVLPTLFHHTVSAAVHECRSASMALGGGLVSALPQPTLTAASAGVGSTPEASFSHSDILTGLRCVHAVLSYRLGAPGGGGTDFGAEDAVPTSFDVTAAWLPTLMAGGFQVPQGPHHQVTVVAFVEQLNTLFLNATPAAERAQRGLTPEAIAARTGGHAVNPSALIAEPFVGTAAAFDDAGNISRECLVQLCSVSIEGGEGSGVTDEQLFTFGAECARAVFAVAQIALPGSSRDSHKGSWVATCATCISRLWDNLGVALVRHNPDHAAQQLIPLQLQFTNAVIAEAAAFLADDGDDSAEEEQLLSEALDKLLQAWRRAMSLLFDDATMRATFDGTQLLPAVSGGAAAVFRTYVSTKVSAQLERATREGAPTALPGTRDGGATGHGEEYTQQHVHAIGLLGRGAPVETAQFLTTSLQPLVQQLLELGHAPSPAAAAQAQPTKYSALCEGLWYLFRVAANFIGDDDESERPCIPVTVLETAGLYLRAGADETDVAAQEQANPVLQLCRAVLDLCVNVLQPMLMAQGPGQAAASVPSPAVIESVLLFLHRVAASYIAPDSDLYFGLSPVFASAFDSGAYAAQAVLGMAQAALHAHFGDDAVVAEALRSLLALVDHPMICTWMLQRGAEFDALVAVVCGAGPYQLSGTHRGTLIGALVGVCSRSQDDSVGVASQLVLSRAGPLLHGTLTALGADGGSNGGGTTAAVNTLHTLHGLFFSLKTPDLVTEILTALRPTVEVIISLLQQGATDVATVLAGGAGAAAVPPHLVPFTTASMRMLDALMAGCATVMQPDALLWFSQATIAASDAAVAIVRASAMAAQRDRLRMAQQEIAAEEDARVELLTASATLILSAATWGLVDVSFDDVSGSVGPGDAPRPNVVSDLCVRGLLSLLREANGPLLAVPSLSTVLFSLLKETAESHTAAFLAAPAEELQVLLAATEYAMGPAVGPELNRAGFAVIDAVAAHARRHEELLQNPALAALIDGFVGTLLRHVATGSVDTAAAPAMANALLSVLHATGGQSVGGHWSQAVAAAQLPGLQPGSLAAQHVETVFAQAVGRVDARLPKRKQQHEFTRDMLAVLSVVRGATLM